MEKTQHIVMWVSKVSVAVIFMLSTIHQSFGQSEHTWGFEISPGISNAKTAAGKVVVYPDSPYYVNLKIRSPYRFSYRVEVNRTSTSKKKWFFSKGLGVSSYSYILNFDYDRQASVANVISDRHDFMFVHGSFRLGKSYQIKKLTIYGFAGLIVNYMIKAKQTVTNVYTKGQHNNLDKFERWAFGWEAGIGSSYPLNDKISLQIRPSMNKILQTYPENSRRIYSFSIGFGFSKKL